MRIDGYGRIPSFVRQDESLTKGGIFMFYLFICLHIYEQ